MFPCACAWAKFSGTSLQAAPYGRRNDNQIMHPTVRRLRSLIDEARLAKSTVRLDEGAGPYWAVQQPCKRSIRVGPGWYRRSPAGCGNRRTS